MEVFYCLIQNFLHHVNSILAISSCIHWWCNKVGDEKLTSPLLHELEKLEKDEGELKLVEYEVTVIRVCIACCLQCRWVSNSRDV